ncbi:MAG: glycosyltransferase [Verrucomicrobiota bacterium]
MTKSGQSQKKKEMPWKVLYIPMYYPILYQTFLRREIGGMAQAGLSMTVVPCLPGYDRGVPFQFDVFRLGWTWILAPIYWTKFYLFRPLLVKRGLAHVFKTPPNNVESWFFLFWSVLAAPLIARFAEKNRVQHVHAAWATAPASIAWLVHKLSGISFSFGAQAYDLYRHGGDNFLSAKGKSAKFIHTTTENNVDTLKQRCPESKDKIVLARRGLEKMPAEKSLSLMEDEVRLLSVGRLVPKKGHTYQLDTCAKLKAQGVPVQLKILGEGPLREDLEGHVKRLDLQENVEFCGAISPGEVPQYYAWGDIFWHTGVVDPKGDRDGLPNVVPEAMAHQLPVISGTEVGVLEAVKDGVTGIVVDVVDTDSLADAVTRLREDSVLRDQLIRNGRQWVEDHFLAEKNAAKIANSIRS